MNSASLCRRVDCDALGGVDSKDSLLGANQIQGFFLGGSLGCEGPFGFERRGMLLSQRPCMLRPKRFTDTCG